MQTNLLHTIPNCSANRSGFMPSYWSAISTSNDRLQEKKSGFREDGMKE